MPEHDATGRSKSSRGPARRAAKWKFEESFVGLPRSLLISPGWLALSSPARHFVDFLMREEVLHAGTANGELFAPYAQLERAGISNRDIKGAIDMAVAFGIVRCTRQGTRLDGKQGASLYALTWLPTSDGRPPTNGYKGITVADVNTFLADLKRARVLKIERKQRPSPQI